MINVFHTITEIVSRLKDIHSKPECVNILMNEYKMIKDHSILFKENEFAIRVSYTKNKNENFSNTIISLSKIFDKDKIPFICARITPDENFYYLINSSFIKKVSHSSKNLDFNNIKGSILGHDILKTILIDKCSSCSEFLSNEPKNFEEIYFTFHCNNSFEENLKNIVEKTKNIKPILKKVEINDLMKLNILNSPNLHQEFCNSQYFNEIEELLNERVEKTRSNILDSIVSTGNNPKQYGEYIQNLIVKGEEKTFEESMNNFLTNKKNINDHRLDDFLIVKNNKNCSIDIKIKVINLNSAPKGVNLDKLLEFLGKENSIFLFYFVGIDENKKTLSTKLAPLFDKSLLYTSYITNHWSGINRRGTIQLQGKAINDILLGFKAIDIDIYFAKEKLKEYIEK